MIQIQLNRTARMPVQEAYCGFLVHLGRFASSTRTSYTRALERFFASTPENLADITSEHIERYILTLQKTLKSSSCNTILMAIKSFFAWAENTYGFKNIAEKIKKLRTCPPRQRILTEEEYQKVIATTSGYTQQCLIFLAMTGLRASEFLSLRLENVNDGFLSIIGKGQKMRFVPLNETAKRILDNPTFLNFPKSNRFWLNHLCIKAAKTAGILKFSPHSLRHRFATELLRHGAKHGVSIVTVSKLLGHSSIKTTEIYLHLIKSDLLGCTDCLG